ncbi:MAG: hypothetical protein U0520_00015 [Candidatus Saccharimonadales bacterium]
MTNFRYSLPPAEAADTAPLAGLITEALTAMSQLAIGPSAANQLLGGNVTPTDPNVASWSRDGIGQALNKWRAHESLLGSAPADFDALSPLNPRMREVMNRLYGAHEALEASNLQTPEDKNIGEAMSLVVVPWQLFKGHLTKTGLKTVLTQIRQTQNIVNNDYIDSTLMQAIEGGTPCYRDPADPSKLLSAEQYLDKKIAEDGPWGVMLIQTSEQAGIKDLVGQSPNQLTNNGQGHLEVAGHIVDGLGIFEWLALTAQEDPRQLSATTDYSWLLANSLGGGPFVPGGGWDVDQVQSYLNDASDTDSFWRPRLAVS